MLYETKLDLEIPPTNYHLLLKAYEEALKADDTDIAFRLYLSLLTLRCPTELIEAVDERVENERFFN